MNFRRHYHWWICAACGQYRATSAKRVDADGKPISPQHLRYPKDRPCPSCHDPAGEYRYHGFFINPHKPQQKLQRNWQHIRVRKSTKKMLEDEARLMLSNAEWAANRMEIHITEAGRHKGIISLDTVIRSLFAYRQRHRERRDASAKAKKAQQEDNSRTAEAAISG